MTYAVGSLVKARGREWVVLPESKDEMLILRPLGGTEDEVTGIYLPLESVESASFDLPDPTKPGDYRSCRLLRDAVRLGFRSSAGPFRSFARIAVEPRPYQLVPLLVALKLDPIRLLIADDVGVGKTIEAALIARELIDRGEVRKLAVLCPPHLAGQWQVELRDKFHIPVELVLPSTATRLERDCSLGQSIFDHYPYVIVSTDFIKSDRRRDDFIRACPRLVIVDEAHTFSFAEQGRGGRHQRHQLLKGLARDADRHLILVTATPHSGKEEAFRSLLAFLDQDFLTLPDELSGTRNERHRRRLAQHLIQRRRGDIRHYMEADTPFPDREELEKTYQLAPEYKKLFDRVLKYAREIVIDTQANKHRQRVRWWSALALLRSLASSPAAAAATLRNRAATANTANTDDADEVGRRETLDLMDQDSAEGSDVAPGGDVAEFADEEEKNHRLLLDLARQAEALQGSKDEKLKKGVKLLAELVKEGWRPIVFCRFIPTAEYVADHLRKVVPKNVEVAAITGTLPPAEREARVRQLAQSPARVLVCTDCLSEGINLQDYFDAVMHYDLSWNPTRHEQREGRVDRYGQPRKTVRVLTYYGKDNQIDGIVLDVLLRKHKLIRSSLGISVPIPIDANDVVEAIFEGLLLREQSGSVDSEQLLLFEEFFKPQREELFGQWDAASEREKRSRTMFAQETIKVEEVARELREVRSAIGSGVDVQNFTREALQAHNAVVSGNGLLQADLTESPRSLRQAMGITNPPRFKARFEPVHKDRDRDEKALYLNRTHPIVEGLASHVMDTALDPLIPSQARRCGVLRTKKVERRTTLLLVRIRYHIIRKQGDIEHPLLAEDCQVIAFEGSPQHAEWLDSDAAELLLQAEPDANVPPEQATQFLSRLRDDFSHLHPHLNDVAKQRGAELLAAHRRVRTAARLRGVSYQVEPKLPPDVLGTYICLPV